MPPEQAVIAATSMTEGNTVPSFTKVERRPDGVAILTLDDPRRPEKDALVTLTPALGRALDSTLATLDLDPSVKAIVLRSAKKASFVVGADLGYVQTLKFAKDAEDICLEVGRRFEAIEQHGRGKRKVVVACVHGPALGGGFELALACTATVASDAPETVFGLPEVKLGLIPAANGLLRVAERAGLRVAIDLGLSGRSLRGARALALGLVDEVVPEDRLLDAACALARRLVDHPKERRHLRKKRRKTSAQGLEALQRALLERTRMGRSVVFRRARREAAEKTRGHYPAFPAMLDELQRFGARGFKPAAKLEAKLFGDVVVSETAHRLIELFFAQTATKNDAGLEAQESATPAPIANASILGAGVMGAGIACVTIQAGIAVRVKDRDDAAVARCLAFVGHVLDERVAKHVMTAEERAEAGRLLDGATDLAQVREADIVIEAVIEDLAAKQGVVREVEALVAPGCIIASNTSSIPITRIAEVAKHPERIVGMHWMRPVERMPLVEIVRGKHTDARAVATAVALAKRQKKTAIVVRDGTGFYTTRILVPLLHEALEVLAEGVRADTIDEALLEWGFPQGPLALLDDLGLDTAANTADILFEAHGRRFASPHVVARLLADDRRGRKNGRGFYLRGLGPRAKRTVDTTVDHVVGLDARMMKAPSRDEIGMRCALAMVNEAVRCLDEGIVRSARDADVGAVLGLGFPAFRGGPLRYVDVLGAPEVLARMRSLEQRFGSRFAPAPELVERARRGTRFYP